MAILKPGPLIAEARGKIGGTVFSRNAGGWYARNFASPTNVPSDARNIQRGIVADLVERWNTTLTDEQRSAWVAYGEEVGTVNSLGETVTLSGIAAYVRGNSLLIRAGGTRSDDGPDQPTLGPSFTAITATVDSDGLFSITAGSTSGELTDWFLAQISAPINPGRLSPAGIALSAVGGDETGNIPFTAVVSPAVEGLGRIMRVRIVTTDARVGAPWVERLTIEAPPP